ncbi:SDR family NAD(P)-dependent oxidoreductase [Rhodoblastus acidophilus]|uniref:SDR family NAD(P)-dependent oxidoreductase n=1 Tax=Rhodoblastus acidophilus TaxID=1074 RepID=A0A6N8DVF7_RHOAC|nr:SDR family NAD(P)-dependent oxidoreductase [Rhodoblastus acidophilus]MCW2276084.1 putative oxidoreductase [Rhodoblastus acidophilus]MTV33173.1 SDR family NAD(P)-dependent oxidoreductase [Rhodoblastus acidophilus]
MKMSGNAILVTGGGSGIGQGLAEAFCARGNRVLIAGRNRERLEAVAAKNPGMQILTVDVADEASIAQLVEQATQKLPDLNVLVNNAGMMQTENLRDPASVAKAEAIVTTNLLGPIRLTLALLPQLAAQPDAAVLNVTSGLAFLPLTTTPTYCATKAALHSWTQSLRWQVRNTSVKVHEIAPPYVRTGLTGERQANDPRAMPLEDYLAETLDLLERNPDAPEILVERVLPLREAELRGGYDEFFIQFNTMMEAGRDGE